MLKRRIARTAFSALGTALLFGVAMSSCKDDDILLTGQPDWLGESIYDELKARGNFQETLKLIDANGVDYVSMLQKTGSKTLFVADDAAWAEFYKSNPWGITSVETMTDAQKSLLFKANMIDQAYLLELLGNLPTDPDEDPDEGSCMRRESSMNYMDSVPVVKKEKFPLINPARMSDGVQVDYWARLRDQDEALILQDNSTLPMIHFMPKFMQNNSISSDDVAFLTNGGVTSNQNAFVNGKVVRLNNLETGEMWHDITCQNGYIHVLDQVAMPLDNMANVIASQPQFSIYSRLLDRFSYPSYSEAATAEYQRRFGGDAKVYIKRYFNGYGKNFFKEMDADDTYKVDPKSISLLTYDPGWNRFAPSSSHLTYQHDAAVMLVPTDEAMLDYLEHDGADLKARYGAPEGTLNPDGSLNTPWDNAPDNVILPLLTNTMLSSIKSSIPSQFASINKPVSGEPMGVEKSHIDQVLWACNGLIYQTNKMYVAPEYVSVFYPAVIRGSDTESLHCFYTVVKRDDDKSQAGEGFYSFMNNMGSKYSLIIPTDNALQTYYDPVSRFRTDAGDKSTAVAYKFYIDNTGYINATAYDVNWSEDQLDEKKRGKISETASKIGLTTSTTNTGDVFNHFKDIINSSLSVGLFTPGQRFYQARNGGPIIVEWDGNNVKGVAGSFQYERGYFIPVTETFDKSQEGNGRSYIIQDEPLMSTFTSPYAAITDASRADRFGAYATMLNAAEILQKDDGLIESDKHVTPDYALSNLNNYHYTIYVPTNESVQSLIDAHKLPTQTDLEQVKKAWDQAVVEYGLAKDAEDEDLMAQLVEDSLYLEKQYKTMQSVITNFVNYHIQDNAVYVDGEPHNNDVFESACLDTLTNRFSKLKVNYTPGGQITVTDNMGHTRTVAADCNNILTRQYYFANNQGGPSSSMKGVATGCSQIYTSAFAVIHQIDAPLEPFANCYYDPEEYDKLQGYITKYTPSSVAPFHPIKRKRR